MKRVVVAVCAALTVASIVVPTQAWTRTATQAEMGAVTNVSKPLCADPGNSCTTKHRRDEPTPERTAQQNTATHLTQAFAEIATPDWNGGDVGTSLLLPDHRRLWVFGDTLVRGGGFRSNSFLIQDGEHFIDQPHATIPDSGNLRYWPMHAWKGEGGQIWVSVQVIENTGPGQFDIRDSGIAELAYQDGTISFRQVTSSLVDDSGDRTIVWGSAVGDDPAERDWIYLYGTRSLDQPMVFGKEMYLARAPRNDPTNRQAWQFSTGTGWSSKGYQAKVLREAVGGMSTVFSAIKTAGGRWLLVNKRDEYLGTDIEFLMSDSPAGPFTSYPAGTIPSSESLYRYSAVAHPDIPSEPETILVSWSENAPVDDQGMVDPATYRIKFREVALPTE